MSNSIGDEDEAVRSHLEDVPDGCGCTEIWEHTSDYRARSDARSGEE